MKARLVLVLVLAWAWFALIGARLGVLQVRDHELYRAKASSQQLRVVELDPPRGTIYDARGRELAVSVPVDSLYALPAEIEDPAAVAAVLAPILKAAASDLEARLRADRDWIWLMRKLDPPTAEAVGALELPGIGFVEESKRYYPMRELAAPLLGYVGTDDSGLRGLEYHYDDVVAGEGARRSVLRDNRGNRRLAVPGLAFAEPTPGKDLYLTLDAGIQSVVEQELFRAVEAHRARGGWAVILEPATGAVLAMASYPSHDANRALEHPELERIRPVADFYEPGSTFKMITAAAALEADLVDPAEVFDCGLGSVTLHGVRIGDHKPFGLLSFREVIARSSNVGAIKVGLRVGAASLHETIRRFGFGQRTGIDLPGESPGGVQELASWRALTPAYVSFGQGIAVTPIQLAAAVAAVADGGRLHRPFVVRAVAGDEVERREPVEVGRPITEPTARELERMLEAVFEPGGTAYSARIAGYPMAGKTGTAQKVVDGGYSNTLYIANFIGFAPARRPVIAGLVAVDEPRAGITSGGAVAAPVFAAVARRVLPYLGVAPEVPRSTVRVGAELASARGSERREPHTVAGELLPDTSTEGREAR
ncbi:MAG TPA: penicillin-binding protein 2 [Thermoanaerobaculia bacterium]|nr:penicillin-binding protein 2 [Thermoanaerobaculia bacterium]